jgi:hypothetical protein
VTKFALYNYSGTPTAHYIVSEMEVPKPVLEPTVSHHIVIVDRSGSMYGVMKDTRAMVEKVMTVEEFASSEMLATLISYSSYGDYTTHFARKKISEVLDPNTGLVDQIRGINATCLTSVSSALTEALNHVVEGETTAISVHTDGYFNDRSPATEAKAVDKWIKVVQKDHANVYVNTISYGNWTDFKILDRIASSLSGKTIVARDVKQVYTALHDTNALLAGRVLPAIKVSTEEGSLFAFHNLTQRKVNGSTTDFAVKGVGPDDATKLYRYRLVSESTWKKAPEPVATTPDLLTPVYVFARTALAQGKLNDAKFALMATRDTRLIEHHYKALTASALADFAEDLEMRIDDGTKETTFAADYGLSTKTSIAEICAHIEHNKQAFTLDLPVFLTNYTRRGVSRLFGSWDDDGTFTPVDVALQPVDDAHRAPIGAFEFNNANATINMQIVRKANLVKGTDAVPELAGTTLDLREIRSYTIVGDGEVTTPVLPVRCSSLAVFKRLATLLDWTDVEFDHTKVYEIPLADHPVIEFGGTVPFPPKEAFDELVGTIVRRGILTAYLGNEARGQEWTAEQTAELKAHYLTPSLNYSPPTANPYTDLMAAISAGEIDTRTSYNITIGNAAMVSVKSLYSANEYFARRFAVVVPGAADEEKAKDGTLAKPKLADLRRAGATYTIKTLSARTKLNAIDEIMMPIFEDFLPKIMKDVDIEAKKIALSVLEDAVEDHYARGIRPIATYIGASGLVPDGWEVDMLDAEGLKARFPDIDIEKKQLDGMFFVNGETVVGVFPEVSYFSTEKGMARAKEIVANAE